MDQVLVSGSTGFIGGYLVQELLKRGYAVAGLDNFSKYGKARRVRGHESRDPGKAQGIVLIWKC